MDKMLMQQHFKLADERGGVILELRRLRAREAAAREAMAKGRFAQDTKAVGDGAGGSAVATVVDAGLASAPKCAPSPLSPGNARAHNGGRKKKEASSAAELPLQGMHRSAGTRKKEDPQERCRSYAKPWNEKPAHHESGPGARKEKARKLKLEIGARAGAVAHLEAEETAHQRHHGLLLVAIARLRQELEALSDLSGAAAAAMTGVGVGAGAARVDALARQDERRARRVAARLRVRCGDLDACEAALRKARAALHGERLEYDRRLRLLVEHERRAGRRESNCHEKAHRRSAGGVVVVKLPPSNTGATEGRSKEELSCLGLLKDQAREPHYRETGRAKGEAAWRSWEEEEEEEEGVHLESSNSMLWGSFDAPKSVFPSTPTTPILLENVRVRAEWDQKQPRSR